MSPTAHQQHGVSKLEHYSDTSKILNTSEKSVELRFQPPPTNDDPLLGCVGCGGIDEAELCNESYEHNDTSEEQRPSMYGSNPHQRKNSKAIIEQIEQLFVIKNWIPKGDTGDLMSSISMDDQGFVYNEGEFLRD